MEVGQDLEGAEDIAVPQEVLDPLQVPVGLAGDEDAARLLPEVLIEQGQAENAERLRRFGLNPDGSIACD